MTESNLNDIIALQKNNPEIFNIHYYIIERNLDDSLRGVHARCDGSMNNFKLIVVEDGKIKLDIVSRINRILGDDVKAAPEIVLKVLNSHMAMMRRSFNVARISKFELLDLNKVY